MPIKSKAQWRWMHAAVNDGEIPESMLKEWKEHTKKKYKKLPETVVKAAGSKRALFDPTTLVQKPTIGQPRPNVASGVGLPAAQPLLNPTVHAQAPVPQSQQPQQQQPTQQQNPQQPMPTTSSNPPQLSVTAKAGNAKFLANLENWHAGNVANMSTLPVGMAAGLSGLFGLGMGAPAGAYETIRTGDPFQGLDTSVRTGLSMAAAPMGGYAGWQVVSPHVQNALSNTPTANIKTRLALHAAPYLASLASGAGSYLLADKALGYLSSKQSNAQPPQPAQNQAQPAPGAWKPSPVLSGVTDQSSPQYMWQKLITNNLIQHEPPPPKSQAVADGTQLNNSLGLQKISAVDSLSFHVASGLLKQAYMPYQGVPQQPQQMPANNPIFHGLPQLPEGFMPPQAQPVAPVHFPNGAGFHVPGQAPGPVNFPHGFGGQQNWQQPQWAPPQQQQQQGVIHNQPQNLGQQNPGWGQQNQGQQQAPQQPQKPQFQMPQQIQQQLDQVEQLLAAGEVYQARTPQERNLLARQIQYLKRQQGTLQAMGTKAEQQFNKRHGIDPQAPQPVAAPNADGKPGDATNILQQPLPGQGQNQPQPKPQPQVTAPMSEGKGEIQETPEAARWREAYQKHFEHGTNMQKEIGTHSTDYMKRMEEQNRKAFGGRKLSDIAKTNPEEYAFLSKNFAPPKAEEVGSVDNAYHGGVLGGGRGADKSMLGGNISKDIKTGYGSLLGGSGPYIPDNITPQKPFDEMTVEELQAVQKDSPVLNDYYAENLAAQNPAMKGLTENKTYKELMSQMYKTDPNSPDYAYIQQQLKNMRDVHTADNPYQFGSKDLESDPAFQEKLTGRHGVEERNKAQQMLNHQKWLESKKTTWDQYSEQYNKAYGQKPAPVVPAANTAVGQDTAGETKSGPPANNPIQPQPPAPGQPEPVREAPVEQPAPAPEAAGGGGGGGAVPPQPQPPQPAAGANTAANTQPDPSGTLPFRPGFTHNFVPGREPSWHNDQTAGQPYNPPTQPVAAQEDKQHFDIENWNNTQRPWRQLPRTPERAGEPPNRIPEQAGEAPNMLPGQKEPLSVPPTVDRAAGGHTQYGGHVQGGMNHSAYGTKIDPLKGNTGYLPNQISNIATQTSNSLKPNNALQGTGTFSGSVDPRMSRNRQSMMPGFNNQGRPSDGSHPTVNAVNPRTDVNPFNNRQGNGIGVTVPTANSPQNALGRQPQQLNVAPIQQTQGQRPEPLKAAPIEQKPKAPTPTIGKAATPTTPNQGAGTTLKTPRS